jgi:hypothetical protein
LVNAAEIAFKALNTHIYAGQDKNRGGKERKKEGEVNVRKRARENLKL